MITSMTMTARARRTVLAAALLATVGLTACGGDGGDSGSGDHGDTAASPVTGASGGTADAGTPEVVAPAGSREVDGTWTCTDGENISVSTDGVAPLIDGPCGTVTITGDNVHAQIGDAGTVAVSGANADLRGQDWGTLTVTGDDSTLNVATVGTLTVTGDGNTVWADSLSSPEVTGERNTVNGEDGAVASGTY